MTNRDKKDSIRGRMAETGESFNVARREVEAATAQPAPDGEPSWELIEVEVATTDHKPGPHHADLRVQRFARGMWRCR